MDNRRQMLSAVVAVALFVLWMNVAPLLFPQVFKQPPPKNQPAPEQAAAPADVPAAAPLAAGDKPVPAPEQAAPPAPLPEFPAQTIMLGEAGFEGGYLIQAQLHSRGGSVGVVWLTDPRYTTLDRKDPLRVVGNPVVANPVLERVPATFDSSVPAIDALLAARQLSLSQVHWEVTHQDASSVTFRYPSPAGDMEVLKTYRLRQAPQKTRDVDADGYLMDVELEVRNLADRELKTSYALQGPVGLPLENADNTRLFREVKLGTLANLRNPHAVTAINLTAAELVKQYKKQEKGEKPLVSWREPIRFAGADDQFFAALVIPQRDPAAQAAPDPMIAVTRPQLLEENTQKPERSNPSLILESEELVLPAKGSIVHKYQAFFGPKRPELLAKLDAESIVQLGWFAVVAKFMLWILGIFHSLGAPYALAIILLTVVVRMAMFPISRKQAIEAEKMKVLAPKMKEMQEKYKNQPEEFARAYREFQKKNDYHPLMGCLPALLQLPIFLGLYNSLYHAVDLRLARFLWINNLAAPDALMQFNFVVPWFGWTELNLLPFITIILFLVQQKMFMPPPASEEQEMQARMMNIMMVVMGFAFYRVPAGLCLYFIASSLWGVCERLILKQSIAAHQAALAGGGGAVEIVPTASIPPSAPQEQKPRVPGWLERLLAAADQAKNATDAQSSQRKFSKDKGDKRTKPRR